MARDKRRSKQRQRQRKPGGQGAPRPPREEPAAAPEPQPTPPDASQDEPQIESSMEPFYRDEQPTTDAPSPVDDISADAEEAKLAIESEGRLQVPSPLSDEVAPTDLEKGRVFEDELEPVPADEPLHPSTAKPHSAGAEVRRDGNKVVNFLRACWAELQRVQWPDRRQTAQGTAVTLGFVVIAGTYLGLMDALFSRLVKLIL